jgi:hypothetical protein
MSSKKKKKKKKKAFFANHSLRPLNKWAHKPQPPSSPIKRTAHRCGNNSVPVPSGMLDYLPSPFRSFLWDLPLRELEMRQHAEELRNEGCWRGSNFLVEEAQYLEGFADRLREVSFTAALPLTLRFGTPSFGQATWNQRRTASVATLRHTRRTPHGTRLVRGRRGMPSTNA